MQKWMVSRGLLSVSESPIVATVAEVPFIRGGLAEKFAYDVPRME